MAEDKGRYFKLSSFMSNIRKYGVLKTNRFEMAILSLGKANSWISRTDKVNLGNITRGNGKLLTLRCESVQLPGMSFATVDGFLRFGYGASETIPYSPVFDQFTATFLVDSGSLVHQYFYAWTNYIVNYLAEGQSNLGDTNSMTNARPYELAYRDDYTATIQIKVYDESTDEYTMDFTAFNAYPKSLPSVDLSYASNDELLKLTIPFSFTDFSVNYNPLPKRYAQTTGV